MTGQEDFETLFPSLAEAGEAIGYRASTALFEALNDDLMRHAIGTNPRDMPDAAVAVGLVVMAVRSYLHARHHQMDAFDATPQLSDLGVSMGLIKQYLLPQKGEPS